MIIWFVDHQLELAEKVRTPHHTGVGIIVGTEDYHSLVNERIGVSQGGPEEFYCFTGLLIPVLLAPVREMILHEQLTPPFPIGISRM